MGRADGAGSGSGCVQKKGSGGGEKGKRPEEPSSHLHGQAKKTNTSCWLGGIQVETAIVYQAPMM